MEARKKKLLEKSKISKQEKKRRKRLEALEKELLEARGEEGKKVKEKFFTETTKLVFTIYFRILKSFPKSQLMGAVLEGLSKFAHVINIEFFSDLVTVFQELLAGGTLSYRDTLLATGTVFKILSGQGEALNIDPTSFYAHLYSSLPSLLLLLLNQARKSTETTTTIITTTTTITTTMLDTITAAVMTVMTAVPVAQTTPAVLDTVIPTSWLSLLDKSHSALISNHQLDPT